VTGILDGKVALVTGASSGIGEATAVTLAGMGAKVALSARRAERLDALKARIAAAGGEALVLPGDVSEERVAVGLVKDTLTRFGRLDVLVNSAGIMPEGGVTSADAAQWRRVMDLNVLAALYTCQAAVGPMRDQGSGDIINISSAAGRQVAGLFGIYCTSKHALNAMSESLRQEVGAQGIRVCVIEPGATNTELYECVESEQLRDYVQQLAQGDSSMSAQDIADAVAFVVALPPRTNVTELFIRPTSDVGA
jgi:NADP-dependent 3-hydroxy acid dehydrogenase YdfG